MQCPCTGSTGALQNMTIIRMMQSRRCLELLVQKNEVALALARRITHCRYHDVTGAQAVGRVQIGQVSLSLDVLRLCCVGQAWGFGVCCRVNGCRAPAAPALVSTEILHCRC